MFRNHESKDDDGWVLYDIVDDLSYNGEKNYTYNHFLERLKIYKSQGFEYTIHNVILKIES
jgi:predicted hydrolase (HD superfamily)